jgi:hypothetical protein
MKHRGSSSRLLWNSDISVKIFGSTRRVSCSIESSSSNDDRSYDLGIKSLIVPPHSEPSDSSVVKLASIEVDSLMTLLVRSCPKVLR